ncbi:hypothetical protein MUK72_06955 [Halococcus dombrowskii]|uniref:Uncharacterized protein n=1 Tax=Halococcus dombrowskii TaxID=179637 RepID=A0AAV3SJN2_HALDO|nr:hypothetical protein [Halococcus dombrowskii]UOO96436.1 hypothetical protein MUK72_06955 [Halococcus dombrowskii]
MTEQGEGGVLRSLKKLLTPSPTSEFHRFNYGESEWEIGRWDEAAFGRFRVACFNDKRCYRIVIRTGHASDEFKPVEYTVELTPYEIANIEDHDDGTRTIDYRFGNDEVVRTRETEKEAKDLALEIMKSIECGDWNRHESSLRGSKFN